VRDTVEVMNVAIFGATGMVGHGALLECLEDPGITRVVAVVRRPIGIKNGKLSEIIHTDFFDFGAIEHELRDLDACFFCLGVSAAGMSEDAYRRVTYDVTLAAAKTLLRVNPSLVFEYVSGAGTDSSEHGRAMWARVKGKTENDLLALSDRTLMFRPGWIQPAKGVVSSTRLYRVMYTVAGPLYPLLKVLFPQAMLTSATLGQAMIAAARRPPAKRVLEARDINDLLR
jgi:uncharacterized protein YbjT (DUF2867 family)